MSDHADAAAATNATIDTIDLAEARRFLQALDPNVGASFGFATFDDDHARGDYKLAMRLYGDLNQAVRLTGRRKGEVSETAGLLSFMQRLGAGVFTTVQALDGVGAKEKNVSRVRAVIADADSDEQLRTLRDFIQRSQLWPSIMVASGGVTAGGNAKVQMYWRLGDCPVGQFTEAQALLLSRCGTDPAAKDLARVLRLPGFIHQKREPRLTRILAVRDANYDLRDFVVRVQAQPQVQDMSVTRGSGGVTRCRGDGRAGATGTGDRTVRLRALLDSNGGLVKPGVRALLREVTAPRDGTPGDRHPTLLAAVASLSQLRWDVDDIHALILPVINREWDEGPWDDHLGRITAWVRARDNEQRHGVRTTTWPGVPTGTQGDAP
jgi:hypothetical protein